MRVFLVNILDALKPRYSELTTFMTALTCVLVAFAYPESGLFFRGLLSGGGAGEGAALGLLALTAIAAAGFVLSIFHVFTKRRKTILERTCMGAFALGANGLAGVLSGVEMLSSGSSVLLFFPLWNIAVGAALLYQMGLDRFEVTDEEAAPPIVLGASIILLLVFAATGLIFHLAWATRFSICMFYSSVILFLITRVLKVART